MVLLCLAALSVQTGRIWRKMVPHLGWQLEFCLSFGPQAKAGGLAAPAPSAPSAQLSIGPESSQDATQETWRQLQHLEPKRDWGCSQR